MSDVVFYYIRHLIILLQFSHAAGLYEKVMLASLLA